MLRGVEGLDSESFVVTQVGTLTLESVTISGFSSVNTMVVANYSHVTLDRCQFSNNSGAIRFSSLQTGAERGVEIHECTFSNNGEGLYVSDSNLLISGSII